jgi:hypothetical protein
MESASLNSHGGVLEAGTAQVLPDCAVWVSFAVWLHAITHDAMCEVFAMVAQTRHWQ